MPLSAKLVIGALLLAFVVNVISMFGHMGTLSGASGGHFVTFAVQLALLTGLYTRQPVAWYFARWVTGFAVFVYAVGLLIAFTGTGTEQIIIVSFFVSLASSCLLFYLLGRDDARAYFRATRKV